MKKFLMMKSRAPLKIRLVAVATKVSLVADLVMQNQVVRYQTTTERMVS